MGWRAVVQKMLRRRGFEVVYYPLPHFLRQNEIGTVLDVGANTGQYGSGLRELGFRGKIVSFEPLSSAFEELARRAERDPDWQAVRAALGSEAGQTTLHISGSSQSSSLLEMLPEHVAAAPYTAYVGDETVPVQRLDAVWDTYCAPGDRVFLKIDTQGYEQQVLDGAGGVLAQVVGLQVELSLVPLYEGQVLAEEMMARVRGMGFAPVWFGSSFRDPATQHLLQVDGVFLRKAAKR